MTSHETYTAVMRHFWQCQREHSFQPSDVAVYAHLVDTCFTLEWKNPFKHANGYLCGALAITEKTLISARNRLQQAGLVGFQSGKHRRDLSTYSLPVLDKLAGKAVNIPAYRAETLQPNGQEVSSLSGENAPDNGSDNSSSKKEKTLSPAKQKADAKPASLPGEQAAFDEFWQAYGKKEDKHKCQQRWATLTPAEHQAALAHVPHYVAATPEKRFRKNPLTYLNGKCWQDEDTPASRAAAPITASSLAPRTEPLPSHAELFGYSQSAADGLAAARNSLDYQRYLAELAEEQAA